MEQQFDIFNDYKQPIHEENTSIIEVTQRVTDKPAKPSAKLKDTLSSTY